jgi:hypothetical protein
MSRAGAPEFRLVPVSVAVIRAATTVAPAGEQRRTIRVSRREFLVLVPARGGGSAE